MLRIRKPISVNYHFTRQCNYKCGFCFHTAKTSFVCDENNAKRGLKDLRDEGMKKVNFSGGEPFLKAKFLGEMCRYAKEDLQLESVSIVSNGSKIKEEWMLQFGKFVDILAVSCDSFREETNKVVGRGRGDHLAGVQQVAKWCRDQNIKFKINTVVNRFNVDEDMGERIAALQPVRWKVFQVLEVAGENDGTSCKKNASKFVISNEEFKEFLVRHSNRGLPLVPEDNAAMRASYLILDEYMRFLDCSGGAKKPSESILKVGVREALKQSGWDSDMFEQRGGVYDWSRHQT